LNNSLLIFRFYKIPYHKYLIRTCLNELVHLNQRFLSMSDLRFESTNYVVSIVDSHIIQIEIRDFMELEKEDIIEMMDWIRGRNTEKKLVNLIKFGNGSTASREAREYASSPEGNKLTIGSALIVKNLAQQLIIDYYIKFNYPMFPTRAFYKVEKAKEWLKNLIDTD